MSVIHLTKESHKEPSKFRIKYDDAWKVLGPNSRVPENDNLPIIYSESKVAIIGGGFSGIAVSLTCLKKLKTEDFVVFDKHANFGGTWWANTYPGCASDIPAVWYSLFDELTDNWSRIQPPQFEMEEYILKVVEKYGLEKHAKFQTVVTQIKYNEDEANWTIEARDLINGQKLVHTSKIVASGVGHLVKPNQLKVQGLEKFEGDYMHSAVWNHEVSLEGKKLVVVGNGCTANQVIPALLRDYKPKQITQLIRSKHYIMPPVPEFIQWLYRVTSSTRIGLIAFRLLIATIAEAKWPLFKGNGLLTRIVRWANTQSARRYMKKAPKKYHDKIIPSFKIGCKRLIYDHSYIPALSDSRLDITNIQIEQINKNSILLKDGSEIEADVIVACTGYDVANCFFSYEIIGRNNLNIQSLWKEEGVTAYNTTLVKDCPNFFMIGGPNTASGHSSVILAIENGCSYFGKVASKVLSGEYKSVSVKSDKYYEWFKTTQNELESAVFGSEFGGCKSWYTNEKVNTITYPRSQVNFWWEMSHPKFDDLNFEAV